MSFTKNGFCPVVLQYLFDTMGIGTFELINGEILNPTRCLYMGFDSIAEFYPLRIIV